MKLKATVTVASVTRGNQVGWKALEQRPYVDTRSSTKSRYGKTLAQAASDVDSSFQASTGRCKLACTKRNY